MSYLRGEAAIVKAKISAASTRLSNFESSVQDDMRDQLWNLHGALASSALAIRTVLNKHKRRYVSLVIVRTSSQNAAALSKSLDDIVGKLDVAAERASQSYDQCHQYSLQVHDFPRYHLEPARRSAETLRNNIASAQFRLETALEAATTQASEARSQVVKIDQEIQQKYADIASNQQKQKQNTVEANQLKSDQEDLERQKRNNESRAARLREVSEDDLGYE